MGLLEYKRKRNFAATPEPAAGGKRGQGIFVVQLHHASHRHFDFRLELDGVLKSWAVPKGPSFDPNIKRLAMEVEDHPISYATFEGDIPAGNYGAGHVDTFDSGTWEPLGSAREGLKKGDLKFTLHGNVLRGSWVLVRTRKQGSKQQWLLIKHRDAYSSERDANAFVDAKTDRPFVLAKRKRTWPALKAATIQLTTEKRRGSAVEAPAKSAKKPSKSAKRKATTALRQILGAHPEVIDNEAFAPELCRSAATPPVGDQWLHEVKWDGYRIVAAVANGKVRLWSRNAIEWTEKVPELTAAIGSLKLKSAQFDGEMIVMRDGRDDFNALQARLSAKSATPLLYMLFDLPHLNGQSLRDVALLERKRILENVLARHPHALLRFSAHQIGNGRAAFEQATKAGLEGIVSKQTDSGYEGARSGNWIKIKGRPSDEFVVIGYTEPKGSRSGIGALLLAQWRAGSLVYVGRVGTGINDEQLRALRKTLAPTVVENPAADIELMEKRDHGRAIWVKPKLVVEAFFQGIGGQGLLRQPAFKTIREDKSPSDLMPATAPKKVATKKASLRTKAVTVAKPSATPNAARKTSVKSSTLKNAAVKKSASDIAKAKTSGTKAFTSADGSDVRITHPEREVFPGTGITKGNVADYYRKIAPLILQEIGNRPLSVVRCPDGSGNACFFQKHVGRGWGTHVHGVSIKEKIGRQEYLCISDADGLLELVQMNVLEFHPWGARSSDPEHADRVVFDLDPHANVKWPRVVAAARDLRAQLQTIGLVAFLRTSGGKGFHVVVPLNPAAKWDKVKKFALGVAQAMAQLKPDEYVSVAGEKNRVGKIFIDYLRNGRGSTSVGSYSLRARAAAGVAMPLEWDELGRIKSGDTFTIKNAVKKIRARKRDPWADIDSVVQKLPDF